jgi:hypothetical protein
MADAPVYHDELKKVNLLRIWDPGYPGSGSGIRLRDPAPGSGSGIRLRDPAPGSKGQECTGSQIPDPDPQHWSRLSVQIYLYMFVTFLLQVNINTNLF